MSTNIYIYFFIFWAISARRGKTVYFLYTCVSRRSFYHVCSFVPSFLLSPSPLTFPCTCQSRCPNTAPTQSGGTKAGKLSESIPESAARPLPESCDSHSSSFPLPRGQASSSSVRRNDPSVWHAQNPKPPRFGVRVQIPSPGGWAGTPANDSEIQRVSALVSWRTEASCEPSCTFFP